MAEDSGETEAGWQCLADSGQLVEGTPLGLELDGRRICLYRVDGQVHATGNVCTHAFALLSEGYQEGDEIECPLHQGRFHIPTGRALCAPVLDDLETYAAREQEGSIWVRLP